MDIVRAFEGVGIEDGHNLNIQGTHDEPLFQANQIGKLLGLTNIRESIKAFDDDEKVVILTSTNGGQQNVLFLKENGVKRLIANSRKPAALKLAKTLGMKLFDYKVSSYEASTLLKIMKAFDGEDMALQYPIGKYQIDMYFPKYKLAVECDEKKHTYNVAADASRQLYIETQLNCTFIRYKPYTDCFCIFDLINKLRLHIKSFISVPAITTTIASIVVLPKIQD